MSTQDKFENNSRDIVKLLFKDINNAVRIFVRTCPGAIQSLSEEDKTLVLNSVAASFYSGYMLGFMDREDLHKMRGEVDSLQKLQEILDMSNANTAYAKEHMETLKEELRNINPDGDRHGDNGS